MLNDYVCSIVVNTVKTLNNETASNVSPISRNVIFWSLLLHVQLQVFVLDATRLLFFIYAQLIQICLVLQGQGSERPPINTY